MYLLIYILSLTSISLAAGAALIGDIFLFISLRHRKLALSEISMLSRLAGICCISTIVAGVSNCALYAIRLDSGMTFEENINWSIILMLLVTFTCALTLRQVHFPALKRHQHSHGHISDSFVLHHESLIATSAVSAVTWISIITLLSAQNQGLYTSTSFGIIMVGYILLAFLVSQAVKYLKIKHG